MRQLFRIKSGFRWKTLILQRRKDVMRSGKSKVPKVKGAQGVNTARHDSRQNIADGV